jgi:hypothetical protein
MQAASGMLARELRGERNRNRRHVHVDEAARRPVEQRRVEDAAHRCVIGEHRHDGIARERVRGRGHYLRAGCGERLRAFGRPVPDAHPMPRLQQIRGNRAAHFAEADHSDIHRPLLHGESAQ